MIKIMKQKQFFMNENDKKWEIKNKFGNKSVQTYNSKKIQTSGQ